MSPLTDSEMALLADLVAERVLAGLRSDEPEQRSGGALVDATAVAARLGVDRATVYAKADELGAVRLGEVGEGRRPRLRFDLDRALAAWTARGASERSEVASGRRAEPKRRGRRQSALGTGPALLPVRGADHGVEPLEATG